MIAEMRHRELLLAGVAVRPVVVDEDVRALVAALDMFEARDRYDVRNPKGSVGGGRFRSILDRITDALDVWAKGDGPDDPFQGFDREQLRQAAKTRGLTMRRGASREEIASALLEDLRAKTKAGNAAKVNAPEPPKAPEAPKAPTPGERVQRLVADMGLDLSDPYTADSKLTLHAIEELRAGKSDAEVADSLEGFIIGPVGESYLRHNVRSEDRARVRANYLELARRLREKPNVAVSPTPKPPRKPVPKTVAEASAEVSDLKHRIAHPPEGLQTAQVEKETVRLREVELPKAEARLKRLQAAEAKAKATKPQAPSAPETPTAPRAAKKATKAPPGDSRAVGRDLFSSLDVEKLANMSREARFRTILDRQGFAGRPTVADAKGVDAAIHAGGTEMFRGFGTTEHADQFRTGDLFLGGSSLGMAGHGQGIYTAGDRPAAEHFAGQGGVVRMALKPGSRIVTDRELAANRAAKAGEWTTAEHVVYMDDGLFAAAQGYDAVAYYGSSLTPNYVVVNRTALIVEPAATPKAPRAAKAPDLTGANGLSSDPAVREVQIENRIRQAYNNRAAGARFVGLADLRDQIGSDVPRSEVDAALTRLAKEPGVSIRPADMGSTFPWSVHTGKWGPLAQRDHEAALSFGGSPKHMIDFTDPNGGGTVADATAYKVPLRPIPAQTPKAPRAAKKATPDLTPQDIVSDASLTPAQKRARLRSRGLSKEQIDALVPLAPKVTRVNQGQADVLELVESHDNAIGSGLLAIFHRSSVVDSLLANGMLRRDGDQIVLTDVGKQALASRRATSFDAFGKAGEIANLPRDASKADIVTALSDVKTVTNLRKVASLFGIVVPKRASSVSDLRDFIAAGYLARPRSTVRSEDPSADEISRMAEIERAAARSEDPDMDDEFRDEDEDLEEFDEDELDEEDADDDADVTDGEGGDQGEALADGRSNALAAEARARTLALLGVTRAAGMDVTPGHDELHHYWTVGEGRRQWVNSPKPWTTLYALVTEAVRTNGGTASPEQIKRWVSRWFIEVKGYAAGSDLNRVAHGHAPRGHRVGPG